jgi:hypothetical protein
VQLDWITGLQARGSGGSRYPLMGNARAQEARNGNRRLGPAARNRVAQAEPEAARIDDVEVQVAADLEENHDDMRDAIRREYDRTRRAATRRRHVELEERDTMENVQQRSVWEEVLNHRKISAVSKRLVNVIANELRMNCSGPLNRCAVMERILGSPLVYPHLPGYYLRPVEAKLNAQLLQNLREELSQVKGVQSSEMLAYKSALLNVVVGGGIGTW